MNGEGNTIRFSGSPVLQFTVYSSRLEKEKITDWEILVYLLPYWTKLLGIAYGSD
jgi:hypothetical protein